MKVRVVFKTGEPKSIVINNVENAFVSEYDVLIVNGYGWSNVNEFGMDEVESFEFIYEDGDKTRLSEYK